MAPFPGSLALNAGDPDACNSAPVSGRDQRGHARNAPSRFSCDIGAVDTGGTALQTLYVSAKARTDPSCATASKTEPFHTLAAALACADNGTTVKLGAGTFPGQVTVGHDVVLVGAGLTTVIAGSTNLDNETPNITIAPDNGITLSHLTVDGINQNAPGVVSGSGRLILLSTTITRGGSFGSNQPDAGGLRRRRSRARMSARLATAEHAHGV